MPVNIFQPAVEIHYSELDTEVLVQTYNLDKSVRPQPPLKLQHEHLPTLLFQLADKGYQINPQPSKFGIRVIAAYTPEYIERNFTTIKLEKALAEVMSDRGME